MYCYLHGVSGFCFVEDGLEVFDGSECFTCLQLLRYSFMPCISQFMCSTFIKIQA
ncbi:hypothetical protein HanXRQr2_Chr10g0448341 [Helianthus annuus]|uniref:Uncharacterized protein n=1 Tax=Helianthus annuus TaxID=4232 RepID=A0A251TMP7_HELAN|nr:hypothetical protein HanXRQr2_Chr10g0448341 [Helianthus annuus]